MELFSGLNTAEARKCGVALAELVLKELPTDARVKEKSFAIKADKTLNHVARELAAFKSNNSLNILQKARLGNAFLWTLKDNGVNEAYADKLTEWLTLRM
ncbi:MAG: hypothetical protein V4542_11645 [Pseudomonadota bacterium]